MFSLSFLIVFALVALVSAADYYKILDGMIVVAFLSRLPALDHTTPQSTSLLPTETFEPRINGSVRNIIPTRIKIQTRKIDS